MKSSLCLAWLHPSHAEPLYSEVIAPAVIEAGLVPFRTGGASAELDDLLLAERAVLAGPESVSTSLALATGMRDARGRSTVLLLPEPTTTVLDPWLARRSVVYSAQEDGSVSDLDGVKHRLAGALAASPEPLRPLRLLDALERPRVPPVEHTVTDVFRDRVEYSAEWRSRLEAARRAGDAGALERVESELDSARDEPAVWIDLLLSYRAVSAWKKMVELVSRMPPHLAATTLVQEQLAFALNRSGEDARAVEVLQSVLETRGPSSETNGLLGRVYKDRWERATHTGDEKQARRSLELAIDAYLRGFEADFRDPYPGINAATLMELREPPDARREEILPVVLYAAERSLARGDGDYWTHATIVEAAVLARGRERAERAARNALAVVRERWEPETTARNLRLIREAREKRGEYVPWARDIEEALEGRASKG